MVSSSTEPDTENAISGAQEVLSEKQDFLPQYRDSTPSTSKDALILGESEAQMNQQQWNLLQDAAPAGPGAALQSMSSSQAEELVSLHRPPSPSMAAAMCLMVEDPYFDTALSSPSSEEAPKDSSQDWGGTCDFNIPLVHVNDQVPELNAAPAGKRSDFKTSGGTCKLFSC